jgi:hypothetical protein
MSRTLIRRLGTTALIVGLALLAGACSSSGGAATVAPASAGASSAPSVVSSAAATAAPSVEPTVTLAPTSAPSPTPTPAPSPSPAASTPTPGPSVAASVDPFAGLNGDPDLEARLPDSFGSEKLTKLSFSGKDFPEDPDMTKFLTAIGKSYDDLSVAIASSQSGNGVFIAMRVKGASEGDLKKLFQISAEQSAQTTPNVKLTETTLDGVSVFKSTDSNTGGVAYFVVRGDTALGVSGDTEASAKKLFAALVK